MTERQEWVVRIIHRLINGKIKATNQEIYLYGKNRSSKEQHYFNQMLKLQDDKSRSGSTSIVCTSLKDKLGLVTGDGREGWILTEEGFNWIQNHGKGTC